MEDIFFVTICVVFRVDKEFSDSLPLTVPFRDFVLWGNIDKILFLSVGITIDRQVAFI